MKRLCAMLLVFALLCPMLSVSAAFDEGAAISLVSGLKIMNGDPDGSFRLDDPVTRAEFTKIAVAASEYRHSVATNMTVSPFPDVPYHHWAASYIYLGATNGLITGYSDATFRPENQVLYEEALNIVLKLLGYDATDFGSSWPYGQIGLAQNIGLTEEMESGAGEALSRREVLKLIYQTLQTKPKNQTAYYIEKLDYKIQEDVVLVATANEDTSVGADRVYTTGGTYRTGDAFDASLIGRRGDLIIKNGDIYAGFRPEEQRVEEYTLYQVVGSEIVVSANGSTKSLDLDSNTAVYYKSAKSTVGGLLSTMKAGDRISLYYNAEGVLDYAMLRTDKQVGPVTAKGSWRTAVGLTDSTIVYRDGAKVTADQIETYDVLYYSGALDTLWAYSKKVTGIYQKAEPNRDSLTSVTVSGVSYTIESGAAFSALGSGGTFDYGDTVTLLLGRTGEVADVINPGSAEGEQYGFLADTGKKEFTDENGNAYTAYYATVVFPSGDSYEYVAKRDYETIRNNVVKLTFSEGVASLSQHRATATISGKVDADGMTLGNLPLADDAEILDVGSTDPEDPAVYITVFPQRLDGTNLKTSDILYHYSNDRGEISRLILNNVTGDSYSYGIVVTATNSSTDNNVSGSYTCDIGGTSYSLNTNGLRYNVLSGQPAKFTMEGGRIAGMLPLAAVSGSVKKVTSTHVSTDSASYELADDATIYRKNSDYQYMVVPIEDIEEYSDYQIKAYYDKNPATGGRVRVVTLLPRD